MMDVCIIVLVRSYGMRRPEGRIPRKKLGMDRVRPGYNAAWVTTICRSP